MIRTVPLAGGIGAELHCIDLTRDLTAAERDAVWAAWIEYGLLLVRNPASDDAAQIRLSEMFGTLEPSATPQLNDPNNAVMMSLAYDPADPRGQFSQHYKVGGVDRAGWLGWHWDQAFMPTIVRGAVLRMTHPAASMGRTCFVDAIAAYDRLDDATKARIEGMKVVYRFNPDFASGQFGFPKDIVKLPKARSSAAGGSAADMDFPHVVHPMVITQQETGRKVLKLSPMHACYVLGIDRQESDALLEELACHLGDPAYAYFHEWQVNDMLAWDNWRMVHGAEGVPLDCARSARRTTISGDYKMGRYLDEALDRNRDVMRLVD